MAEVQKLAKRPKNPGSECQLSWAEDLFSLVPVLCAGTAAGFNGWDGFDSTERFSTLWPQVVH